MIIRVFENTLSSVVRQITGPTPDFTNNKVLNSPVYLFSFISVVIYKSNDISYFKSSPRDLAIWINA